MNGRKRLSPEERERAAQTAREACATGYCAWCGTPDTQAVWAVTVRELFTDEQEAITPRVCGHCGSERFYAL